MNIGLAAAGVLFLSFSAFAQQTVTIPVPGTATTIQGDLYGHGTRGLILAHGGGRNRESWHKQAQALSEAGFVVLAIDYRGDTISDKGTPTFNGAYEDNTADVLGAAAYLRAHGAQSISGVGASMGGSALAEADAQSKPGEFERIVILASSADEGGALTGRKLFIVARDDVSGSGPRLPGILNSYAKAPAPKELIVLEGSAHAQAIFDTDQGPQLMKEILRFLTEP
jgi:dienelactone hydrolase